MLSSVSPERVESSWHFPPPFCLFLISLFLSWCFDLSIIVVVPFEQSAAFYVKKRSAHPMRRMGCAIVALLGVTLLAAAVSAQFDTAAGPPPSATSDGYRYNGVELADQTGCLADSNFVAFLAEQNATCYAEQNATAMNVTAFCGGACATLIRNKLPQFYSCMGSRNATYWRTSRIGLCDKEDGEFCGTLRLRLSEPLACESAFNEEFCGRQINCIWKNASSGTGGSCSWRWPLDKPNYFPCAKTGCAFKSLISEVSVQTPVVQSYFASIYSYLDGSVCLQDSGTFCYPSVQRYITAGDLLDITAKNNSQSASELCKTSARSRRCFTALTNVAVGTQRGRANREWFACMDRASVLPEATMSDTSSKRTARRRCHTAYATVVSGLVTIDLMLQVMCATSTSQPEGPSCLHVISNLVAMVNNHTCFAAALSSSRSCLAACDTVVGAAITALGCCGYYVNRLATTMTAVAPPNAPDALTLADVYGPGTAVALLDGPLVGVRVCPSLNSTDAYDKSFRQCRGVEQGKEPPRKSLATTFRWDRLKANSTLKILIEGSLKSDTARTLGVSEETLKNATLNEDTNRKFSRRRMFRLEGNASSSITTAARFDYVIEAASPQETASASQTADERASLGDFTLTNTASTVDAECVLSSCVVASAATTTLAPSTNATTDDIASFSFSAPTQKFISKSHAIRAVVSSVAVSLLPVLLFM